MKIKNMSIINSRHLEAEERLTAWFERLKENRSIWLNLFKRREEKREKAERKEQSEENVNSFKEALDNLSGLSDAISGLGENIALSLRKKGVSKLTPEQYARHNNAVMEFSNALRLNQKDQTALSNILKTAAKHGEDSELANKFTRVSQAQSIAFIGPLPHAFEEARRHKNSNLLQQEFEVHKYAFIENNREIRFTHCNEGHLKINFNKIHDGETNVTRLAADEPQATNKLAYRYVQN